MVNHICSVYYCLGLVCALRLALFTTSADTLGKHGPSCKASDTGDWEEEETLEEDNSDEDNGYLP